MTTAIETYIQGRYGQSEVQGVYPVLGVPRKGTRGWFVTIPGESLDRPTATVRILIDAEQAQALRAGALAPLAPQAQAAQAAEAEAEPAMSDDEKLEQMREMFDILNELGWDMARGNINGMVVYGPPGVGKSHGILEALDQASMDRKLAGETLRHEVHTGFMTPLHLFKALFNSSAPGQIAVFDDCDSILADPDCLNMLKAALDTTGRRMLAYNAESRVLAEESIPNRFEFCGGIIFITNVDFDSARGRIADHLEAIVSRCHYLDLTIDTRRDKMLWIREVTMGKEMLRRKGLNLDASEEILGFIESNLDQMRELSLRMVLKLADLYKSGGQFGWEKKARVSCLRRAKPGSLSAQISDRADARFGKKQARSR